MKRVTLTEGRTRANIKQYPANSDAFKFRPKPPPAPQPQNKKGMAD